ncbi:tripartite tricarboxylate transporter substrate-binding protein [Ponticoccus litoralis]|uniref:Tripartite tricarboxylate transporter substrate-binding protein n=2 Tax=Ponticoccus TaxID=983507 RepID=A0AAW9SBC2_9RHOB
MVAGGVDIIPSSLAEGRSMIDAGRVTALASMSAERQEAFPDVPTLAESTGSDWTVAVWRSVAAPAGLPDEVKTKLMDAIETAYNSDEYQTFMQDRGFGLRWARGDDARDIVAADDAAFGEVMKQAGLAAE